MNKGNRQQPRHNRSHFVCGLVSFLVTLSACWAAETNFFFYSSRYEPQTFNLGSPATFYKVVSSAASITEIVKAPTNVVILTNETFATEYEGMAWGYPTAVAAWTAAVSCYRSHYMVYSNVYYDNVGWVTGTREAYETWGAFVWLMQDTISFYSSTSSLYVSPHGATSEIACVIVGSLGVYNPQTHVTEVGPILPTNYMGEGVSTDAVFKADLSTYYRIVPKFKWKVNDDDIDHDGIPGFADGFNWDGSSGNADDQTPDAFHTWNLYLYNACEPTQATVRVTYSSSDPASVTLDGSNYTAASGAFRLWKKNCAQPRNKNSFAGTPAGDFVPPGVYLARDLGFTNRAQELRLYVEPVNTSATNEVILFEVDADGPSGPKGYVSYAKIGASLLRIELLQDILGDLQPLEDWPQQGAQARSPKFLFGKEDNAFVRIQGPSGLGNDHFKVKVTSESDKTGVELDLRETSSGVYMNSEDDDELLRLANATAEDSPADTIKIVEEEVLTFKVFADGKDTYCSSEVVVDRGEFASGTGNDPNLNQYREAAADAFENGMETRDDLQWWDVGRVRSADISDFITDAGANNVADHEADFVWFQCHGNYDWFGPPWDGANGELTVDTSGPIVFAPESIGAANWTGDVDWIVMRCCGSLCEYSTPTPLARLRWASRLTGRPHPAHGLLGYCEPTTSEFQGGWFNNGVTYFLDALVAEYTMPAAWIYANTHFSVDEPYAVACLTADRDDRIRGVIFPDMQVANVTSNDFSYWWYHAMSDDATGTEAGQGTLPLSNTVVQAIERQGLTVSAAAVPFPQNAPSRVLIEVFSVASDDRLSQRGFHVVRFGDQRSFFKELQTTETEPVDKSTAIEEAGAFVREVVESWPRDAELRRVTPMFFAQGSSAPIIAGYVVEYGHRFDGLWLEGDFIKLTVARSGVRAYSEKWHAVRSTDSARPRAGFVAPENVVVTAVSELRRVNAIARFKCKALTSLRPVYFCDEMRPTQAVAAYQVAVDGMPRLLVGAADGMLLVRGGAANGGKDQ